MTTQIDPTKPPTHTTGSEHYRAAERLLADAKKRATMDDYLTPDQGIAAAHVHALLAAAAPPEPITVAAPTPANQVAFARAVVDTITAAKKTAADLRARFDVDPEGAADMIDQLTDLLQNGAAGSDRQRYLFKETEPGTFLPVDEAPAISNPRRRTSFQWQQGIGYALGLNAGDDVLTLDEAVVRIEQLVAQQQPAATPSVWDDANEHVMPDWLRDGIETAIETALKTVTDTVLPPATVEVVAEPAGEPESEIETAIRVVDHVRDDLLSVTPSGKDAMDLTLHILRGLQRAAERERLAQRCATCHALTSTGCDRPDCTARAEKAPATWAARAAADSARLWLEQIDAGTHSGNRMQAIDLIRELTNGIDGLL